MTRWRQSDRHDRVSRHLHVYRSCRTIASSRYCSIVLASIVAPLLSNYRTITSLLSHYCVIALSIQTSMVGWCDSELHGPNRIPYVVLFSLSGKYFIMINCLIKCKVLPAIKFVSPSLFPETHQFLETNLVSSK